MTRRRTWLWGLAGVLALCLCAAAAGLGGAVFLWQRLERDAARYGGATAPPPATATRAPDTLTTPTASPTWTPSRPPTATPTPRPPTPTPTVPPSPTATPTRSTLEAVLAAELPTRDLAELASRLRYGGTPIPTVVATAAPTWQVGDVRTFWIANTDTHTHKEIEAVLLVQTEHVQMWVEQGEAVDLEGLRASAERFEAHTYPVCRETFGSEWTPGVDGDPHLLVLHARDLGGVGGYFSAADEFS
ncbi:MAG: hypothetical protein H5T59_01710, partial [Anaerolineae bacterium]|nr:hypothetical protein [Anaerolineae bacterium]